MILAHRFAPAITAIAALLGCSSISSAFTTSMGQSWDYEPDAWVRANDADTSYFGWDVLDATGQLLGFGQILDDSSPDLGDDTTATGTRFYQGTDGVADPDPTTYGHRSGSGNYYAGFSLADDTIEAIAPASGAGGYTTVVLQAIGQPGFAVVDAVFAMNESAGDWTLEKSLYGKLADDTGLFWVEWSAPGAGLSIEIDLASELEHAAFDSIQIDTFWSADSPAVNSISAIGVPEPSTIMLALGAVVALVVRRRVR